MISFLFFEFLMVETLFDWRNASKILKNKIKNLYRKRLPKFNESISVGPSQYSVLDFPKNSDTLDEVNKLWQEYYKCLESKYTVITDEKTAPPYAIAAFTESFIE